MSRFVKRRYLRNTSLSRTQRILQAKLVGRVATHKTCAQAAILDNLYYFDFGCLTKRHMKFYAPSGDILSSTIKPLNTMKIYTIETKREDGTTFTNLTASEHFATECSKHYKEWNITKIQEWEVKTQGKNYHSWGKPTAKIL